MFVCKLWEDGGADIIGRGVTETAAWRAGAKHLRCDVGPLAAVPATFAEFADAVANATGGEACVTVERA